MLVNFLDVAVGPMIAFIVIEILIILGVVVGLVYLATRLIKRITREKW